MARVSFSFTIGKKTLDKFKRYAKASDMSASELIRCLVLMELTRAKKGRVVF